MNSQRPAIPKKLAAKIVAAQKKIINERDSLFHSEIRLAQDRARVAEFEKNPVDFAGKYYGKNPVDSYPVQTNISRCRESIEYREERIPKYMDEIERLESNLVSLESEILEQVQSSRPSAGRIPWPVEIDSIEIYKDKFLKARAIEHEEWKAQAELQRIEDEAFEKEMEKEEAERQRLEDEQFEKEIAESYAQMTDEERRKTKEQNQKIVQLLKEGKITAMDIIEHLKKRN